MTGKHIIGLRTLLLVEHNSLKTLTISSFAALASPEVEGWSFSPPAFFWYILDASGKIKKKIKVIFRHFFFPVPMISQVLLFRKIMHCKFLVFLLLVFFFLSFFSSASEFRFIERIGAHGKQNPDFIILLLLLLTLRKQ